MRLLYAKRRLALNPSAPRRDREFIGASRPALRKAIGERHRLNHSASGTEGGRDDDAIHGCSPPLLACSFSGRAATRAQTAPSGLDEIDTVVVIYAENRSFDNLYGTFPGANGLQNVDRGKPRQLDRDGTPLKELPPVWDGLTAKGVTPPVTQAQTEHLPNAPFAIDDPTGLQHAAQRRSRTTCGTASTRTRCRSTAARTTSSPPGPIPAAWSWATTARLREAAAVEDRAEIRARRQFLHGRRSAARSSTIIELICACAPIYPNADKSPAKPSIAAVEADGVTLKLAANSPTSAMDGIPKFVARRQSHAGLLRHQHDAAALSAERQQAGAGRRSALRRPGQARPRCRRRPMQNIGDLLSRQGRRAGPGTAAPGRRRSTARSAAPVPNFQFHHQPFNYFADLAPGHAGARRASAGWRHRTAPSSSRRSTPAQLPQVAFYKPQGNLNEHAGYADVHRRRRSTSPMSIAHLEKSPQWQHMLVVVTYDENGGFWDHVAPPKADRWGPGHAHSGADRLAATRRRAPSITRSTTRPRSCASSPSASGCRCCRASRSATRRCTQTTARASAT